MNDDHCRNSLTILYHSVRPTRQPTRSPTRQPTRSPTRKPSRKPTWMPTSRPSSHPSSRPTSKPTSKPSSRPSSRPTSTPSRRHHHLPPPPPGPPLFGKPTNDQHQSVVFGTLFAFSCLIVGLATFFYYTDIRVREFIHRHIPWMKKTEGQSHHKLHAPIAKKHVVNEYVAVHNPLLDEAI